MSSDQAITLDRAIKITYTVESGQEILNRGHILTWELWNILCHTFTGYGRRDYEGKYTVAKTYRKLPQAVALSDRCKSTVLGQFDIAMKSWWSNLKSNPNARPPKSSRSPRNLKFQIGRNAKPIGNFKYKLTVLGAGTKDRHAVIRVHLKPGVKMSQVKWLELSPDSSGSASIEIDHKPIAGGHQAAIDLGIVNIATIAFDTGESIMVSGKGILASNQWHNKRAAKCKPKNWKPGMKAERPSARFKSYRRKAGNIQKLACHNLTRYIIDQCRLRQVNTLIVGDLGGIRDDADHGKSGNQRLHNWPFYQIVEQLKYKGAEYGIEVQKVSERNTSKDCHICGNKGVRNPRGLLKCKHCGLIINSDVNGAFGILNKVSPVPVIAGIGVEADFPGLPSPSVVARRIGEVSQIHPTFSAKFDLRNWRVTQADCNAICSGSGCE